MMACNQDEIDGCITISACNYNALNDDDGSCVYVRLNMIVMESVHLILIMTVYGPNEVLDVLTVIILNMMYMLQKKMVPVKHS